MITSLPKGKRKIAIVGSAFPLRGGGIATFNERMAKAFIENGDEVKIYTFSLQYPSILFPGKTQYSEEEPPEGLDIEVLVNSINPLNWIKVGRRLKKLAPDIVIFRYWIPFVAPSLGTIAKIIRKNKKTKVIAITDNVIPHENKPGDKLLSRYFIKNVDAFITLSKSVLNDLSLFDTSKPRKYTPHPLYDNFGEIISKADAKKQLKLDNNSNYILFFGFIRDYKGLDTLLEAFADKRLRKFPVKLLIAGEFYTKPDKFLDIIKKHKLEKLVELHTEFIPNTDVHKYFCASDVVVQPYKTATQSGITQVAYHFNKPMVTTDVGGLAELIPDNKVGFVVKNNIEQVAEAIYKFYELNKEEEFSKNAALEKKKYSWEIFVQTILELNKEI
ncbi:MAG: glycosyltransferase [Prolixibacteraceae bacterium]|jgi:D-inositol-3-phosphate glycosyltransferase|nr:glycosyltransferase [Prolixibacteraceae bacterium]MBT6004571.1 glycosyltransferase [Prolixibacteraceae bacterium]MBT6767124.1 glycosyltransferase [Prolixibacteraceae bacterium]MBT7000534.1 glycosyltransferase [Prolixibacteraceae bacterium]MBT7393482.1 glycosyltransferase [Prolixibacteraceae bacterium]